MNDLRKTRYTDRIMESTGADHREALVLETALRWGPDNSWGGNPGTLDHLGAAEFDGQVRDVFHLFLMDPAERDEIEKLAEAEHTIPPAPKPDRAPAVGDRVRVWFSGNGVVVDGTDDPKMRPFRVRLDGADADTFHNADQLRPEIGSAVPGGPLKEDDVDPFPPVEAGATAAAVAESDTPIPDHDCMENAVPYVSDGPLGHGWECGVCGEFLQAG
jgi:hypothetical protein